MNPVFVEVVKNLNTVMVNKSIIKKITLGVLFALSFAPFAQAQEGKVTVEADSMLEIIARGRVYARPDKITGFRILLFTGDRVTAEKLASDFKAQFPDEPVMLKWDEPNFKVVGGLFYSRKAAAEFRKKCNKFAMAIIINELVDLPPVEDKREIEDSE
jgi:hypothetical protein